MLHPHLQQCVDLTHVTLLCRFNGVLQQVLARHKLGAHRRLQRLALLCSVRQHRVRDAQGRWVEQVKTIRRVTDAPHLSDTPVFSERNSSHTDCCSHAPINPHTNSKCSPVLKCNLLPCWPPEGANLSAHLLRGPLLSKPCPPQPQPGDPLLHQSRALFCKSLRRQCIHQLLRQASSKSSSYSSSG